MHQILVSHKLRPTEHLLVSASDGALSARSSHQIPSRKKSPTQKDSEPKSAPS
eukprot:m.91603 g.91603  ORF g.91603 m.91603 type:complete len:53 (-) comp11960_c0_seq3:11-169(-)